MRRSGTTPNTSTARVLFIGAYAYARDVLDCLDEPFVLTAYGAGHQGIDAPEYTDERAITIEPDLIVVAGWRRLLPASVLAVPRLGAVGFHSAKLPEYPGRAPVPWALLRGDTETWNTLLFLDDGVDSGDIIDERRIPILRTDNPDTLYREVAQTSVEMLRLHLPALLRGTAPRTPQDMSRRGPLTTADGWARL